MNRDTLRPNTIKNRYPELDMMRFFAASAVVVYHYTSRDVSAITGSEQFSSSIKIVSKFGYLGVELFFMISGFVILASALNRNSIDFAISRATRLYPTYWAAMIITTCTVYFLGAIEDRISAIQFLTNITMLNDFIGIANIDDVYWTLHAEIKFYFCVFILILFNRVRHYKVWLTIWLITTVSYLLFKQPYFMGWLITPYYSSYFIGGAVFYLLRKEGKTPLYTTMMISSCILSIIYAYKNAQGFIPNITEQDRYIAASCVGAFYLIFYLFSLEKISITGGKYALIAGGITYPLYLIHARVGYLLFDKFAKNVNPYLVVTLTIVLIYGCAYFMHIHVEKILSNKLKKLLDSLFKRVSHTNA